MFKIERRPEPAWRRSDEFQALRERLFEFHAKGGTRGTKQRFPLPQELGPFEKQIEESLHHQFDSLCAYTEVPGDGDHPLRLVWHRPTNDAASLDGRVDHDHYWWLTLAWDNWYLASALVESVKSYLFPVVRERSPLTEPPDERPLDTGLLIDPCRDEPAWWLRFEDDGSVSARQPPSDAAVDEFGPDDRAELTIRILDLDNDTLRKSRHEAIVQLRNNPMWRVAGSPIVDDVLDSHPPHTGALLQAIIRHRVVGASAAVPLDHEAFARLVERVPEVVGAALFDAEVGRPGLLVDADPTVRDELADRLIETFPDIRDSTHGPSFDDLFAVHAGVRAGATPAIKERPARLARSLPSIGPTDRIRRVLIKNFRAIHQIELTVASELVPLPPAIDRRTATIAFEPGSRTTTVAFEPDPVESTQWKALLGENGSGKSSIMHAIALALTGDRLDEFMSAAGLEWSDILRRTDDSDEHVQGRVLLEFTGGQKIDLRFTSAKAWFHGLAGEAPAMHVNVRGYGATRLLRNSLIADYDAPTTAGALTAAIEMLNRPTASRSERLVAASDAATLLADLKGELTVQATSESETTIDIGNLLDSNVPVIDATKWLLDLDKEAFNVATLTLSDLLGDPSLVEAPTKRSRRRRPRPRIVRQRAPGGKTMVLVDGDPLEVVSDGYRSIIAVACDIMKGVGGLDLVGGGVSDLRRARGIVLIDELGAHLHPRWRMQITDRLRRAFPNVQFLVTTHEPLCLRGLQQNEVIKVSKYETHGVVLQEIEMSPARYRVDQLLTSDFFGLDSAIDPELDALYRRYYELRRDRRLNDDEQNELQRLEERLNQHRLRPVLGYTRRDQLMYEAIDSFLADEPTMDDPGERQRRRKKVVETVADEWRRIRGFGS